MGPRARRPGPAPCSQPWPTLTARAWEGQELAKQAARAETLAETDRIRAGLLAAVGHDLRTPLAGIKAATSSLRQDDVRLERHRARRAARRRSRSPTDRLSDVISNLLAMSRIQAGALPVSLATRRARRGRRARPAARHDAPGRRRHPRHPAVGAGRRGAPRAGHRQPRRQRSPVHPGWARPCEIHADATRPGRHPAAAAVARLHVVDHGPGIQPGHWDSVFVPFQRLGDQDTTSGLGLGLAIARGFLDAMNGRLEPSSTHGGGLTMTISLPTAP